MALDSGWPFHIGIFHSNVFSGAPMVLGRWISTLSPVALTYPVSTRPDSAVDHRRAIGPPPVSRARCSLPSHQRGDMTQLYLSSKLRLPGLGMVCWFHGWWMSTGLPSGSWVTNLSLSVQ